MCSVRLLLKWASGSNFNGQNLETCFKIMLLAKIVFGLPLNKFTNETVALTIYGALTNYLGNSYYQKQHRPHPLVSFVDDVMSLLLITHDKVLVGVV